MSWHKRFKQMKKELGYTNNDIAEITELNYDSIKNQTQPNKDIPKWLKLAIVIFERLREKGGKK
jgi:DNA-binding XRE family transcriptional regulator